MTTDQKVELTELFMLTWPNNIKMVEIEGKHLEIFIGKERAELLATEIETFMKEKNAGKR